jgi:hypothetical protein
MKLFIFSLTLLTLFSCSTQNLKITEGNARTVPTYEGTSHFVFWGLGQEKMIDPKEVCADKKVAQVSTSTSFLNGLLNGITWGFYAPRSYAIYCE